MSQARRPWAWAQGWPLLAVPAAIALAALPPGASTGGVDGGLTIGGLSRAVAWALAWTCLAVAGMSRVTGVPLPGRALAVALVCAAIAVTRVPPVLAGLLLLAAVVLPALAATPAARGWNRTLVVASVAGFGLVGATVVGRQHGDETIGAVVILGFVAAAGMVPFGWHAARWLEEAPPGLAAIVAAGFGPAVLAALVGAEPLLAGVHELDRAGPVLAVFGGATAIAAAVYALPSPDWRTLAVRTVPCELGLALVGLSSFDSIGLQGAALTIALLAVTRPVLLFADELGPRHGPGLVALSLTLLGAAGLPPTMGFPARLLVLEAAARVSPWVAAVAVAALAIQAAAIALVLRRRLGSPWQEAAGRRDRPAALAVATSTAVVLLAGGVAPGLILHYGFQLVG